MNAYKIYEGRIIDLSRVVEIEYENEKDSGDWLSLTLYFDFGKIGSRQSRYIFREEWQSRTNKSKEEFNAFCEDLIISWSGLIGWF